VKYFVLFLAVVHGLIHLMGFVNGFGLAKLQGFSGQTISPLSKTGLQITSVAWLVAALLFVAAIAMFFSDKNWPPLALSAIALSQVLIVLHWQDAKWGTVANIIGNCCAHLFCFATFFQTRRKRCAETVFKTGVRERNCNSRNGKRPSATGAKLVEACRHCGKRKSPLRPVEADRLDAQQARTKELEQGRR
jgi:hypothetical protein